MWCKIIMFVEFLKTVRKKLLRLSLKNNLTARNKTVVLAWLHNDSRTDKWKVGQQFSSTKIPLTVYIVSFKLKCVNVYEKLNYLPINQKPINVKENPLLVKKVV